MLTENDVIDAVANYLETKDWRVESKLTTSQTGIDLEARKKNETGRMLIEAKGETSSKGYTKNFGKPFSPTQALSHVSRAFYTVAKLQSEHPTDSVGIALPDNTDHTKLIDAIGGVLCKLDIHIFFVAGDKSVRKWKHQVE